MKAKNLIALIATFAMLSLFSTSSADSILVGPDECEEECLDALTAC